MGNTEITLASARKLMRMVDYLNGQFGSGMIRFASMGQSNCGHSSLRIALLATQRAGQNCW